jgi:hypothetical protein
MEGRMEWMEWKKHHLQMLLSLGFKQKYIFVALINVPVEFDRDE